MDSIQKIMARIILSLFSLLFSGALYANPVSQVKTEQVERSVVGAVCVIRAGDKLVMLSEVITKKISLPGGYIEPNTTPEESAIREALEETGINVEVSHLIEQRARAVIYACVAKQPILVSTTTDSLGYPIVESWFAEHFGKEVRRVYLIGPDEIKPADYRFPKDQPLLAQWLAQTPESKVDYYSDLSGHVNLLHQYELQLISQFQHWVKIWPQMQQSIFDAVITVLNLPGEVEFIVFIFVITAALFGAKGVLRLSIILLSVTYIASIFKLGIGSPRPFYIMPALKQANAYGFGFPSGHTLMATVLWGLTWYYFSRQRGLMTMYLLLPIAYCLALGQAVARVWYGVHFITDTIASLILGTGMVAIYIAWLNAENYSLDDCIVSKWFWLSMSLVIGLTASFSHAPEHVYLFAASLGVFLSLDYVNWTPISFRQFSHLHKVGIAIFIAVGMLFVGGLIGWITQWLAYQSTVSLIVLSIRAVGCCVAAVWLVAGTSLIRKVISTRLVI
ncbi:bifunctional NUDIX hydrolase/phosphatase PAP2 family protein [Photobacterium kagoshimensis]|uniref:bifunctional NUDIX hydrolase/phosphatase PAP2 family protein n=1 Tax=Photobacterium kagoshimensis TaxID=2910242 RepID=UPI003D0AC00E